MRVNSAPAPIGGSDLRVRPWIPRAVGDVAPRLTLVADEQPGAAALAAWDRLVLDTDDMPRSGFMLTMSAFHRSSQPPGPAGRWFVEHLKTLWRQPEIVRAS